MGPGRPRRRDPAWSPGAPALAAACLALACAGSLAVEQPPAFAEAAPPPAGATLRIVAANISSGRFQSYPNPGPGARILRALDADVVLIQEFNVHATAGGANDDDAVDAWVDDVLGLDYAWFREPGGDAIPNGLISRWPIREAGEWRDPRAPNRDFAWARIDVPGEADLWAVSVHLLTADAATRDDEAAALVRAIRAHPVPEDDYLIVGGDFNTRRRTEPALATFGELLDVLGPFPDDGGDPPEGGTNASRSRPYDWVLADAELEALAVTTEIGGLDFDHGLVFDSRIFTQEELDESFPPVRAGDSGAPQMQHMAVVRDFRFGGGAPPRGDAVELAAERLDFGAVEGGGEGAAAPRLARVGLRVRSPAALLAVAIDGDRAAEFTLVEPDPEHLPAALEADRELAFAWAPDTASPGVRRVVATLVFDADPGALELELTGRVAGGESAARDLGGWRLEQTGGAAAVELPPGTRLAPGALLVIGRAASRAAFEAFWGPLPVATAYLDGTELAGDPGFPVINGGERFRLVDAGGAPVDPAAGHLPESAASARRAWRRLATSRPEFAAADDLAAAATPGRFEGRRDGTGRVVLSEFSDATGPGAFVFEFVELFFDAAPDP